MKVQLLGTAAAEGFPAMFCRCAHCMEARRRGGKNIRTRTSALIDGELKIDFPADTLHHVLTHGLDLGKVKELLITHTHEDHLVASELTFRGPVFAHGIDGPLDVYGHDLAISRCMQALGRNSAHFRFHLVQPFRTYQTRTATITPLRADHDPMQTCLLYLIEKDGKSLLYGHDTGWFPDDTWEWLSGKTIDVAVIDCTNGTLEGRRNHMNVEAVIDTRNRLRDIGAFHDGSVMVATHFSHNIGLFHDDLERLFAPERILVAYDGMTLEI